MLMTRVQSNIIRSGKKNEKLHWFILNSYMYITNRDEVSSTAELLIQVTLAFSIKHALFNCELIKL